MAGDWIKVEEVLPDKPEVAQIAHALALDHDAVVGKLVRVWVWASRQCHADGVTNVTAMSLIDRAAGVTGFAKAMCDAGWLVVENDLLRFPKFDRHMAKSAKDRALSASRQAKKRRHAAVTEMSRSERDKSVTREEKRRVYDSTIVESGETPPTKRFTPPTIEDVTQYAHDQKLTMDSLAFVDYWTACGWRMGSGKPMKDWRAAVRNWARRDAEKRNGTSTPERRGLAVGQVLTGARDYRAPEHEGSANGLF